MTHLKKRATVIYQKRAKNGETKKISVRLSPAASLALDDLKKHFTSIYAADTFPSLAIIWEKAILNYSDSVRFNPKTMVEALSELKEAGYPVGPK